MGECINKHGLTTALLFYAFAARQNAAGDRSWYNYCMAKGEAKVNQAIRSASMLASAVSQVAFRAMTHYEILVAARAHECMCGGRAAAAWEEILRVNGIDRPRYCRSILELFRHGGGKDLNHFYVGGADSGKTALTRPILALYGDAAFLKPQVGTSFALAGIVGAKALVWNDFYWPHPPLSWGDLLNVLDNEGFNVGVPKGDGATDYPWNRDGSESVIAFLTSNAEVVYIKDNAVDEVRTDAWRSRFGKNIYILRGKLPRPDRRYKVWLKCTRCYADWIFAHGVGEEMAAQPGEEEDVFGFGGDLDEAMSEAHGPVSQDLSPGQMDMIARNREEALRRRAAAIAHAQAATDAPQPEQATAQTPPPTVRGRGEDPSERSRTPHASDNVGPVPALPVLPAIPVLPVACTSTEPLRDLNLFLQRHGMEPPVYTHCLENDAAGLWTCQAAAGGVSARGTGRGKNAAKREAAKELHRALQDLASGRS